MKVYLIVAKGKHEGMPIPIEVDLFLIGSSPECQLRSTLPGLAPQHCALIRRDGKLFLRDLDGGAPTLVNGELLPPGEEWPLHRGDRLEMGPCEFMLQFQERQLSRRDLEEWALRSLDQNYEREREKEMLWDVEPEPRPDKPVTPAQAAAAILEKLQAHRGEIRGRMRISREGSVTVACINDVFLVEAAEIGLINKELRENLGKPNLRVLLDFKNIKRMSTVAVKMIDEVCSWLKPWGSTVAMCRIRPEIEGIMKDLALRNQIPVFPDKRSALAARW
jgi:hypothetical protein